MDEYDTPYSLHIFLSTITPFCTFENTVGSQKVTIPNLITLTDPRSAAAEAYRTLRTTLMFSSVENPIQTLLVTSAVDGEGKSDALANLAVTFAQAGNKTILVDADMRRPSQHAIWHIDNYGLTTMMIDDASLSNPPLVESGIENLLVLAAGEEPPNPADLLSSKRMNEIIGILKARATYVLFDSPPVLAATDAALLGVKVDGALLVVKAGQSRRDQTSQARDRLEQVNVRVVGAVLTNAARESRKAY
ncbi:MAG: CpsD/CapB family tyrosine-protein kinase [Anaerolineae bacterium]|nr:CpsD/CapB family tyrosine-protein kinase [Anaerolineae bacterium]